MVERCSVKTLIVAGSLRKESLNDKLATLAADVVTEKGGTAEHVCAGDFEVPFYDGDIEAASGVPLGAQRFSELVMASDALIIASPEYNASVPAVLKNLIDWVSRVRPQPFNGKQALLLSASPAMMGGNRGLWALRIPLEHLGARVYPDMFSLAQAHEAFTDDGRLQNATLQKRFESTIDCFLDLVEAAKHFPVMKKQWVEFLGEKPDPAIDRVETAPLEAA
jgi:chromate reductase